MGRKPKKTDNTITDINHDENENVHNVKSLLNQLLMILSLNKNGNDGKFTEMLSKSLHGAFNKYINILGNYVTKTPIVVFSDQPIPTCDGQVFKLDEKISGKNNKYQIVFYNDMEKSQNEKNLSELDKYAWIEYKYNVSSLISYYSKRFPEILSLFDSFADICISKNRFDVNVSLDNDFIYEFFIQLYKEKIKKELKALQSKREKEIQKKTEEIPEGEEEVLFEDLDEIPETENTDNTEQNTEEEESKGLPGVGLLEQEVSNENTKFVNNQSFRKIMDADMILNDLDIVIRDDLHKDVESQYYKMISEIRSIVRDYASAGFIRKLKRAVTVADIYGYSVITVDKKTKQVTVYDPTQISLYRRPEDELVPTNFIVALNDNEKVKILNKTCWCYVFSLSSNVLMPIPNIVKISWYLYLLDLVEVLIIMNDMLKSKSLNILQIPIFDMDIPTQDEDTGSSVMDSLNVMNMIVNNIENKLVFDDDVLSGDGDPNETALSILKNVGLSISYVPKMTRDSRIESIRLDVPDNKYESLYNLLIEKIFSTLAFPLWMRTGYMYVTSVKSVPREVIQFGNLIFMSRVNAAVAESKELTRWYILNVLNDVEVSYLKFNKKLKPRYSEINVRIENYLDDYLFDREREEQVRNQKISNILSLFTTGTQLNPEWILKYVFPEYDPDEILMNETNLLQVLRDEVVTAVKEEIMKTSGEELGLSINEGTEEETEEEEGTSLSSFFKELQNMRVSPLKTNEEEYEKLLDRGVPPEEVRFKRVFDQWFHHGRNDSNMIKINIRGK